MRSAVMVGASMLAFFAAFLASEAKPDKEGQEKKEGVLELAALQGAWEQVSLERDQEKLEETEPKTFLLYKQVNVVKGNRLFTACRAGIGVGVWVYDIRAQKGGTPAAIDFVDVDTNSTARTLVEIKPDSFVACQNSVGKTLKRPEKIAATEENQVAVFQRMVPPVLTPASPEYLKNRKTLAGIWKTVEVEHDGERFNRRTKDPEKRINFWRQQRFFYFQDDFYLMCSAEGGNMAVEYSGYRIGIGKDPRAINFAKPIDPKKEMGETLAGLYKLQESRLTFCWNKKDGETRPDEFGTVKGDGRLLLRLERVDTDK